MSDFREKAGAFFSQAAGTAKDLAVAAANKTKQVSRIAKLNMDIVSQKDTIKKAYAELGQLYYENHHDAPEGLLIQACQEIDVAKAAIEEMEAQIAQLKASGVEDDVQDADFETVVDQTAAQADIEVEIVEEPDEEDEPEVIVVVDTPKAPEAPETPEAPEVPQAPVEPALEETPTEPVPGDVSPDDEA